MEYGVDSNQIMYPPTQSSEYLFINKGDQLKLDIKLTINGQPYSLKEDEKVWFDVREYNYNTDEDTESLIHIESVTTRITIPEVNLDVGDYEFSVGIIYADGSTKTLSPSILNVTNKLVVGKRYNSRYNDIRADIYTDTFSSKLIKNDEATETDPIRWTTL